MNNANELLNTVRIVLFRKGNRKMATQSFYILYGGSNKPRRISSINNCVFITLKLTNGCYISTYIIQDDINHVPSPQQLADIITTFDIEGYMMKEFPNEQELFKLQVTNKINAIQEFKPNYIDLPRCLVNELFKNSQYSFYYIAFGNKESISILDNTLTIDEMQLHTLVSEKKKKDPNVSGLDGSYIQPLDDVYMNWFGRMVMNKEKDKQMKSIFNSCFAKYKRVQYWLKRRGLYGTIDYG
jgi:hypothetical protein